MLLKSIKLAGFKSFADPTVIPIRSHLCGIVGPNGCGKSNVIDAVRWVIGESSAKQLRGKSMADVIFNGSNRRQPMGRALVELHFDNQQGRLGGEYAKYTELSIKREVQRNGQSSYYINNTPCRRRDVLDIFLGTGLGPRSYAIIEQGMVSRLVEAKPHELRDFIEEAAGVSKVKERRRETQNRMQHTRDNLERVHDVVEELERQMRSLNRQASAAERYQSFSAELSLKSAQLKAMQWNEYSEQVATFQDSTESLKTEYEAQKAKLSHYDTELERLQAGYLAAQQAQQQAQQVHYQTGTDTARVEQQLQNQRERQVQWQAESAQTQQRFRELQQQVREVTAQLAEVEQDIEQLAPQKPALEEAAELAAQCLMQAEDDLAQWQDDWEQVQSRTAQAEQRKQVGHNTIEHSSAQLQRLQQQQAHWQQESSQIDDSELAQQLELQQATVASLEEELHEAQLQIDAARSQQTELAQLQQQQQTQQQQLHAQLQRTRGRQSSLQALQEAALSQDGAAQQQWLQQYQLAELPRLAEQITVAPGWERAAESILKDDLAAVCCDADDFIQQQANWQRPTATQVKLLNRAIEHGESSSTAQAMAAAVGLERLVSVLQAPAVILEACAEVYLAEDQQQAIAYQQRLSGQQLIVTKQGDIFAANWLRIGDSQDPSQGQLQRQQELLALAEEISNMQQQHDVAQQAVLDSRTKLEQSQQHSDQLQGLYSGLQQRLRQAVQELSTAQARRDEVQRNAQKITTQLEQCALQLAQQQAQLTAAEENIAAADIDLQATLAVREELEIERETKQDQLQQARVGAQYAKQQVDEFELRLNANENQRQVLQQSHERDQKQLSAMQSRQTELQQNLATVADPDDALATQLEALLQQRLLHEEQLKTTAADLAVIEEQRQGLLDARKQATRTVEQQQHELQEQSLEHKEVSIRRQTLVEQLRVDGHDSIELLLAELPTEAKIEVWEPEIEQLKQRISRLGPINLAAIDELAEIKERYEHLAQQKSDLEEALTLLESAIDTIDQEMQQKFRHTFDALNAQLQELFPSIFNGGRAYLERQSEEEGGGVLIRAQPPGKRNASIHMLSGGEKALTAIALVFAMFQLNPAPFCILDEVDAPLDDANVGRYCALIKKMSEKTQYLVISHSKITMSMADQLLGVTMQEAGVSRLVAVDMEEALAMAE